MIEEEAETPEPIPEPDPEPEPVPEPVPEPPSVPAAKARSRAAAAADIAELPTLQAPAGTTRGIERALEERKRKAAAEPPPVRTAAPESPPPAAKAPRPTVAWPSGRLSEHEFPDLVREVYGRRWTGILTLNHTGAEKSIRIQEGRLVFASSSIPDDRLGELLLRRGRITLHQYVEAGQLIRKGGKRLGAILVDMGALDARELVKVVVDHTLEIIYGAFQWTEGMYHFTEAGGATEDIVLKLSTPEIILEGIRRIDRWSRIERAVGGLETRYQRVDGYQTLVPQMTLSPDKMGLLTGLSGIQDLGTICKQSVAAALRGLPHDVGVPRHRRRAATRLAAHASATPRAKLAGWPGLRTTRPRCSSACSRSGSSSSTAPWGRWCRPSASTRPASAASASPPIRAT